MLDQIFATKLDMTQAWTLQGKRKVVTRCRVDDNLVIGLQSAQVNDFHTPVWQKKTIDIYEIGFGQKKLKSMKKPLKSKLLKGGFSVGARKIRGVRLVNSNVAESDSQPTIKVGDAISLDQVLEVGDVVKVQGTTKGRGFAGVMKRHGFKGGPRTHGQSDRERAPGSIGAGTDPGRVWKGMKMAGRFGNETKTVEGLVVLHIDQTTGEVWLSGPIPGHFSSLVRITKTGIKKNVELDRKASGLPEEKTVEADKDQGTESVPEAEAAESQVEPAAIESAESDQEKTTDQSPTKPEEEKKA